MKTPSALVVSMLCAFACGGDDGERETAADPTTIGSQSTSDTSASMTMTSADDDGSGSASATMSDSASATMTMTSAADDSSSAASSITDTSGSLDTSGSTGAPSSVCDGIDGEDFIVPSDCDGPSGNTTTEIPSNGMFATSWFGCYFGDDGDIVQDPGDNCEFACGDQGLCPGQDGPNCEANLKWFAADADRYGCGGRIRVTNCENGNAVVLTTLDRGPNCNSVEMECGAPVLDMSHDAMVYLFDGGIYGGCDLQPVVVEPVDEGTALGPV